MDWDLSDLGNIAVFNGPRKSKNTYRIHEDAKRLLNLGVPVVLTLPRSGRHWLMLALECYFRESISYDDSPWSDNSLPNKLLFIHEDMNPEIYGPIDSYLCLYRKDIVSCIFSNIYKSQVFALYEATSEEEIKQRRSHISSEGFLLEQVEFHCDWFKKYHPSFCNRDVVDLITFEDLQSDICDVIRRMCLFLKEPYIASEAARTQVECTKEKIASLTEPFEVNMSEQYKNLRFQFRSEYEDLIYENLFQRLPGLKTVLG